MSERIRKLKHYFQEGRIYFVTSVTKNRREIFKDVTAARFLTVIIAYHKYILNYLLFGYVIMYDHFHLLLQSSEKYPLSKIMNYIKGNFARKYNKFLIQEHQGYVIDGSRPLRVGYDYSDSDYYDYSNNRGYDRDNKNREEKICNVSPVWQKEYYETMVRDEKDFIEKLNYIHTNPVKRGLVSDPGDYEFSSYHQYYGKERQRIQIPIDKIVL